MLGKGLRLLSPAPEDERIPALQPDHVPPGQGMLDEERVDALLPDAGKLAFLADVDLLRVTPGVVEQALVGQVVVENDVGRLQQAQAL